MSDVAPHEIIEDVIDSWMLERRLADRKDKRSLWAELADALGVSDRQVKRYFTGDTPLPIDKIIPFCNHVKSTALTTYLVECVDPPQIQDMDSLDFVEELIKNIDAFSIQARIAARALNNTPSVKDLRELRAAGRRLRDQLRQFEGLYYQTLIEHEGTQRRMAREKSVKKAARIRQILEDQGQTSLFPGEEK